MCTLRLEVLECRITPDAYRWVGGGADQKWSTKENWYNDTLHAAAEHAPYLSDDVSFTTQATSTVDLSGVRSLRIAYQPSEATTSAFTVTSSGLDIEKSFSIVGANHTVTFERATQVQNPVITAAAYEEWDNTYAPLTITRGMVSFTKVDLQIGSTLDPYAVGQSTISSAVVVFDSATFTNLSSTKVFGGTIELQPQTGSAQLVNETAATLEFNPSNDGTQPDVITRFRGPANLSRIRNSGTFRVNEQQGLVVIVDSFENRGLVEVNTGSKLAMTATDYAHLETWATTRLCPNSTVSCKTNEPVPVNMTLKITRGLLEGSGTIQADVQIGSTINPNDGARLYVGFLSHGIGIMSIAGLLNVNAASTTTFEVNGTGNYSELTVTGCAMWGTLQVLMQDDYTPSSGSYHILVTDSFDNHLSNYDLPTWYSGLVPYHFDVQSGAATGITLTVVQSD